jgi:hypothetical protein
MGDPFGEPVSRGRSTERVGWAAETHPPVRVIATLTWSRPQEVRRRKPTGYLGPFRVRFPVAGREEPMERDRPPAGESA